MRLRETKMRSPRGARLVSLFAVVGVLFAGCGQAPDDRPLVSTVRGEGLGSTWSVKWIGSPDRVGAVGAEVTSVLGVVDAAMSTWREDSDLSRIRSAEGAVPVARETASVVDAALQLARDSGGAFDPTVQPLMELWGFAGVTRDTVPTDEEIEAVRSRLGWSRVRVSTDGGRAMVDGGGTALDLSAIAKGWAVDRVSYALSRMGIGDHMVEVGGEVRVQGHGPRDGQWGIGIDYPWSGHEPGERLSGVLSLTNAAVATSGNYRQSFELKGTTVHHTMDPRTGRPATSRVLSATVIAPDCRSADGLATAMMVLGREGIPWVEQIPATEAILLMEAGDRARPGEVPEFETVVTSGAARYLTEGGIQWN